MIKRYRIETPEQLRILDRCLVKDELSVNAYATVWSATRRGNGGTSKWDDDFSIRFDTVTHKAYIDRAMSTTGAKFEIRRLNYNKALVFCRDLQLTKLE